MSTAIESFFVSLGFEIDTDKVDEFKQRAESLRNSVLALGAVATAAAVGIGAMVLKVADGMDATGDFADIVGMSAREVDALGKVAAMNDSSMDAMKSTIEGLSGALGLFAHGQGRAKAIFEEMGISAKDANGNIKDVTDVLGDVSDKFTTMSAAEKLGFAKRLGIDKTLIPLLSKGKEGFMELRDAALAANPLTDEQYKQADRITKAWEKAKMGAGMYVKLLGAKLFPIMEKVLNTYNDWVKKGKDGSKDGLRVGLQLISDVLGTVWDWVVRLASAGKGLLQWFWDCKPALYTLAAAAGLYLSYLVGLGAASVMQGIVSLSRAMFALASGSWAGVLPFVMLGLVVAGFLLILDDLVNYFEGNDSIIGQLSAEFPWAANAAIGVLTLLGMAFTALQWTAIRSMLMVAGSVWVAIAPFLPLILAVGAVGAAAWLLYDNWDGVVGGLKALWEDFTSFLQSAWEGIKAFVQPAIDNIADMWGFLTDLLTGNFDGAIDHLKAAWDRYIGFWLAGFEKIKAGIAWVADKLGMGGANVSIQSAVNQAPSLNGGAGAASSAMNGSSIPMNGVLGGAAQDFNNSKTSTTTVNAPISGTTINVNSPDPGRAGQDVMDVLNRQQRNAIRNGQSGVDH